MGQIGKGLDYMKSIPFILKIIQFVSIIIAFMRNEPSRKNYVDYFTESVCKLFTHTQDGEVS